MRWLEIPVTPDAEEARRAAREELDKAIYHHEPGMVMRALRWIGEKLSQLFDVSPSSTSPMFSVAVLAIVLVALVLSIVFFRRIRGQAAARSDRRGSARLFEDDADSSTLVSRAHNYAASGNFTEAFREQFRALIRYADERALIADRPGMTAQEAARDLGALDSEYGRSLHAQADLFDAASYGDVLLGEQAYQALIRLIDLIKPRLATLAPQVEVSDEGTRGQR